MGEITIYGKTYLTASDGDKILMVINKCYGGFCISEEAEKLLKCDNAYDYDRYDKDLIRIVQKLGEKANGRCSKLHIIEVHKDHIYANSVKIDEYDGDEGIDINKERTALYFLVMKNLNIYKALIDKFFAEEFLQQTDEDKFYIATKKL